MSSTPNAWSVSVARSFIDTSILVYADDAFDSHKQLLALDLVVDLRTRQEGVLSTQVLQEYFVTATRKLGLEAHVARQRVTQFGRFELIQPTLAMLLAAMDLQQNHSLSFWDALIVQTASAAHCRVLYSEDMQAGARIG
jgi:predicted nucleic acid-binding protein